MQTSLWAVVFRTTIVHTLSYTAVGVVAFYVFRYGAAIAQDPVRSTYLRDPRDPRVTAGPLLQPVRGLLFGAVFYLLRGAVFAPNGWWVLWIVLVVLGIVGTFAPAPGSIEGWIYLKPSPSGPLWGGLAEVLAQSLLLSFGTFLWVTRGGPNWLTWVLGALFALVCLMPVAGLLARRAGNG